MVNGGAETIAQRSGAQVEAGSDLAGRGCPSSLKPLCRDGQFHPSMDETPTPAVEVPHTGNEVGQGGPATEPVLSCQDELRGLETKAAHTGEEPGYAIPGIGVSSSSGPVGSGDVLRTLRPIWNAKRETAQRTRQRIGGDEAAIAAGQDDPAGTRRRLHCRRGARNAGIDLCATSARLPVGPKSRVSGAPRLVRSTTATRMIGPVRAWYWLGGANASTAPGRQ